MRKEFLRMSEFLCFVIGTMIGGLTGVVVMCLMQISRLSEKEVDKSEKPKRADTFPTK